MWPRRWLQCCPTTQNLTTLQKSYTTNCAVRVLNFSDTVTRWRFNIDGGDAALVLATAIAAIAIIDRISVILARYGDAKEGVKELVADLQEIIRRCREALGR